MAARPTITDVANKAGVSMATVDRVLNGRQKVREETARRVYEAAQEIGYHAAGLIGRRMQEDKPRIRYGFVMSKEKQPFYHQLREELEQAAAALTNVRAEVKFAFSQSQTVSDFARTLSDLAEEVDVLGATVVTHSQITDVVADIQARGVPCFSMFNDFAAGERQSYVGMNNMKVGRIAASMIATAVHQPGKVAVFVGGHRWHGHELREAGFRSYFREIAPDFQVLETLVNLETRQLTYEATLGLLDRQPDLRGIYCSGGGMEGAIAALREVREPGEVALVVNEITPDSRAALVDRYVTLVIGTPLPQVCKELFSLMTAAVEEGPLKVSGQRFLQPQIYLPECV